MQREQIGALKAVGYDNRTVGLHYLKLVLLIVVVGAVLGVALGAWFGQLMTALYTLFFRFPVLAYRLDPWLPCLRGISRSRRPAPPRRLARSCASRRPRRCARRRRRPTGVRCWSAWA